MLQNSSSGLLPGIVTVHMLCGYDSSIKHVPPTAVAGSSIIDKQGWQHTAMVWACNIEMSPFTLQDSSSSLLPGLQGRLKEIPSLLAGVADHPVQLGCHREL